MENIEVKLNMEGQKGKAYVGNLNSSDAEMTFSLAGEQLLIIDHTEVSETLRGKGVGKFLLDEIVNLAREKKIKILPLCPFAKSVFDKDATIRDVLRG